MEEKTKERNFLFFFFCAAFFSAETTRAFFFLSLEGAQRRKTLTLRKTREIKSLHMTARITYKRRYGFRCSRRFFFCSQYSRGEENVG
jgi:hypothetical protein